ncbi:hypothetical protein [Dechloromonas hortensis]|uniref:hypothetical protein n=1 Tax=Dechloromonas hortensis TaxID=337779 RepID=UPI001290CAE4|nr:hypothetical protein [Dechloromonas hortensis]
MIFDALSSFGVDLAIKAFSIVSVCAGVATALVAIATPLLADTALVLAAVFAPLALAMYPISKTWSYNAVNLAVQSGLTAVGCSVFLQILLGDSGILQAAVNSTAAKMNADNQFLPVVGGMLGMICVYALSCLVLLSIPRIVQAVFGGFSVDGGAVAGVIGAAAGSVGGAAGRALGPAAGLVGKGAATAVASGAAAMAKGMGDGVAKTTMSQTARVLNSLAGGAGKAPGGAPNKAPGGTPAGAPKVPQGGILRATPQTPQPSPQPGPTAPPKQ